MHNTWLVLIPMILSFLLHQATCQKLNLSDLSNPRSWSSKRCGLSRPGYICDPAEVLPESTRISLQQFLERWPRDTPCLCGKPCSLDHTGLSRRLVMGVLVLDALPRPNITAAAYAEAVRSSWTLGSCPGNDVLMLAIGSKIHLAYGSLVSRALTPDCIRSLPNQYDVKVSVNRTVQHLAIILREFFVNPCMCRSCKNAYSWFKIPAMLLACFCLLMWLSLVGRRAYLRRVHLPSVRGGCCSLTDLGYMNNRAYMVRLPPRALAGTRMIQPHRVMLTPNRSTARISRVARQTESPAQDGHASGLIESRTTSVPNRCRSHSPPPPSYASLMKGAGSSVSGLLESTEDHKSSAVDSQITAFKYPDPVDQASRPPSYTDILALTGSRIEPPPDRSGQSNGEQPNTSASDSVTRPHINA